MSILSECEGNDVEVLKNATWQRVHKRQRKDPCNETIFIKDYGNNNSQINPNAPIDIIVLD